MKAARLVLRRMLRTAIPDIGHIDRFNNQYSDSNQREEDPIDYDLGALFIETETPVWETLIAN